MVNGAGEVFWRPKFALHERFIDDYLRSNIREFTPLPGFDLLSHRLEVSLHSVNTDRNANR